MVRRIPAIVATASPQLHRVVAAVLPGTVLLDLAAPAHLFGHCGAGRYAFDTVAIGDPAPHTTCGLTLATSAGTEALATADTLVVAGYAGAADRPPPEELVTALRAARARGARVLSICTGAFALAHAGLLDGCQATTHWDSAQALAEQFPRVTVDERALYVDAGQVLTSAGVAAGLDLCLHVVRRDHGASVAAEVARRTVIAPHRAGGQAQYLARPVSVAPAQTVATTLERTRAWALEHLDAPLEVVHLAAHANVSPRTFARRFAEEVGTTPARWIAEQRVALALELLETTDLAVDQIAWRVGFGNAATLRARLRAIADTTPSAYRRAFARR